MKNNNNLIDTKDNSNIKIVPCKVQDILQYKVLTLIGNPFDRPIVTLSLQDIISKIFSNAYDFSAYNVNFSKNRQIITILAPKSTDHLVESDIWKYMNKIGFVPTLAYSSSCYDCPELNDEYSFMFTYILNEPIKDIKMIESIEKYLSEIVFAGYKVHIIDNIATEGTLTELYVSDNIYLPVKGDVSYGE